MAGVAERSNIVSLLNGGYLSAAAEQLVSYFTNSQGTTVHIAVLGKSGSGKSAFINALRGVHDNDTGAAPTGQKETTKEPKMYKYPDKDTVTISELPGLGSSQHLDFNCYDFFIILSSGRFKNKHFLLAIEIQKKNKKFYFVRAKVDRDLNRAKRWKKCYNENQTLAKLRNDCVVSLRKGVIESPQVFLISSWNLNKFDFGKMLEVLEGDLPDLKRRAFLLALPNFTVSIIEKKKAVIMDEIWKVGGLSAASAVVPIPGLSIACDITLLVCTISSYRTHFGLDEDSLGRLAKRVGKTAEQLRSVVSSTLGQQVSSDIIKEVLIKTSGMKVLLSKVLTYLPFVGQVAAAVVSYDTINSMLNTAVEEMAEDAKRMLAKSLLVE
ncbi:interferon-inducible GTPase 5-like [Scyliorhinus canicula]|uniref:interferon-inducible GTPase 5-like n=1 Tax=Scyliorhinus canicula TaxID=7830 RepID=UPI0018F50A72|nr:interferon-inducible GTPase 5-like [Scyliorhinus canicula]